MCAKSFDLFHELSLHVQTCGDQEVLEAKEEAGDKEDKTRPKRRSILDCFERIKRICPVCEMGISGSNAAINEHIDACLEK